MPLALLFALASANPSWPASDPNLEPEALSRLEQMPDDPEYAPGAACTGQLALYAFTPACTPAVEHPALGSGIHADRAWLLTTGRPEVTIAFVEGGASFGDPDLVARFRLSTGELPAPSTSSSAWDANGDGAFTVLDYTTATGTVPPTIDRVRDAALLARPDRGDTNGNGLLDPADLIAIFSDGTDADQNGYVDDVAGWDFVGDDNDPSDRASGEAARALATANNGIGGAGVCPQCTLLALRAGSDGRGEGHRIAVAVAYAVDAGAAVVASSLAAPDHDAFLVAAADYAFRRGVPIVASSGTASSVAPPIVWPPDRVLVVGGLRHDRDNLALATTALAPDACAGFGPRLDLAAPTRCDTAGAGLAAGVLGLVRSAERGVPSANVPPLDPPLDAAEIMMLATGSADDDDGANGWDQRTGYGRINARAALDAVVRRRIPVPLEITSPAWFEVLDPTGRESLLVRGVVSNHRYARATWQLAYAVGMDPEDGEFISLGTGTVGAGEDGMIAGAIPAAGLLGDPTAPPEKKDALAVTLRLQSTASPAGDAIAGEIRRVVFVQRDLELLPAFPLALSARPSSPRIADLDRDGAPEIAIGTSQGILHLIGPRGTTRRGWPQNAPAWAFAAAHSLAPAFAGGMLDREVREPILGTPAVAEDLIVAVTSEGSVLAFDPFGESLDGFPLAIERGTSAVGIEASPALADLDGDGALDIVIGDGAGKLCAFSRSGRPLSGFPVDVGERIGAPAIGDVDLDGGLDLAFAGEAKLHLMHGDGRAHAGWPVPFGGVGSVALADTDGDDQLELVVAVRGRPIGIFEADGSSPLSLVSLRELGEGSDVSPLGARIFAAGAPSIADMDGDGALEVFLSALPANALSGLGAEDQIERLAGAWSLSNGAFAPAYPRRSDDPSPASAVAADVDGDHRPEMIIGDGRYRLVAYSVNGRNPALWPKLTGGTADGAAAAGDLDGDGNLDVVAATREGALFAWRTQSDVEGVVWEGLGHDNRATHNAATAISVRTEADLGEGCACTTSHSRTAQTAGWILLALLSMLRRRR